MLKSLASSILAQILHGSDASFLVLRLWQCGDRLLNAKLSSSITYINLNASREHFDPNIRHFPQLVFSVFKNLKHLILDAALLTSDPKYTLGRQLQNNAFAKLETLDLSCISFRQALSLSAYEGLDVNDENDAVSCRYDMRLVFPALKTLRLYSWHERQVIFEHEISKFPSTLTELSLPLIDLKDPSIQFMASLPRSLEVLRAKLCFSASFDNHPFTYESFWQNPPPHLRYIDEISFISSKWHNGRIFLPSTLETVGNLDLNQWPFSIIQQLPSSFTTLDGLIFASLPHVSDWRDLKLPPQFVTLNLKLEPEDFPRMLSLISTMPSTLTEFHLLCDSEYDFNKMLDSNLQKETSWPSSLQLFKMGALIPHPVLSVLPDTLTELICSYDDDDGTFPSHHLPRHLKRLILLTTSTTLKIGDGMPLQLHTLEIDTLLPVDFEIQSFDALPPSLTSLSLQGDFQFETLTNNLHLPTKLTYLSVHGWKHESLSLLPSSITELELTDVQIPSTLECSKIEEEFMKLPLGLKRLHLEIRSSQLDNPPDFAYDKFYARYSLDNLSIHLN